MLYGYCGMLLRINLTTFSITKEQLTEEFCRTYLGGNGFGARLLIAELEPKSEPLGEENRLVFVSGPLNGSMVPMASKFCAMSKSPLTGTIMDGFSSGRFGSELKYAGYDLLVIEGAATEPVYVHIEDEKVSIRSAVHLWGIDTFSTQSCIKEELGDETVSVACIGPAGENLVRYACILTEQRAVGSGGLGAVMGSKKLKAIAIRGNKTVSVSDAARMERFTLSMMEKVRNSPAAEVLSKYGTAVLTSVLQYTNGLPTRNWQKGTFAGSVNLSAETLVDNYCKKNLSCFACLTPCGHYSVVRGGPYKGTITNGPEFQSIGVFGPLIENDRLDAVIRADRLCDEYGLGQISAGVCIAFAMECFEHGLLTASDTDGIDLRFGNHEAMLTMLKKISFREGLGDLLAEGVKRASAALGNGAEDFAMHVKGMEMSCFCPRSLKTQALGFSVSSKGPSHNEVRITAECGRMVPDEEIRNNLGPLAKELTDWSAVANSLIWCLSAERVLDIKISDEVVEMLNFTTGMDFNKQELILIAERVHNLERAFNIREGFTKKDDSLPLRFLKKKAFGKSRPEGGVDEAVIEQAIKDYYFARGWDEEGRPTREQLIELGLHDLLEEVCSSDRNAAHTPA